MNTADAASPPLMGRLRDTAAMLRLCAVALLSLAVVPALGFHFTLPAYDEQCFIYEASADLSTVTVTYLLTPKTVDSPTVEAVVYDPQRTIVMKPPVAFRELAHFSFQTASIGRYDVCFKRVTEPATEMEIDIDSALNQDYRDPTIHASAYEVPVVELMPVLGQAVDEMETLSARQDRFERTANSTYFRVILFTVLNAAAGLGAGLWQVWNLRRFFKEKKVV